MMLSLVHIHEITAAMARACSVQKVHRVLTSLKHIRQTATWYPGPHRLCRVLVLNSSKHAPDSPDGGHAITLGDPTKGVGDKGGVLLRRALSLSIPRDTQFFSVHFCSASSAVVRNSTKRHECPVS